MIDDGALTGDPTRRQGGRPAGPDAGPPVVPRPRVPGPGATRHERPGPGATRHERPGPGATRHERPGPGATRHEQPGPAGTRHEGAPAAAGRVAATVPPVLLDRLTGIEPWKRSGQSELLRATDRATGRRVLVKIYFEHVATDTALLDRLRSGTEPRVIRVLDHGSFTDPFYDTTRCWEMQPYLPGGTLTDLIARTPEAGRPALARAVLVELTAALRHCHDEEHGLGHAHRDLKPDNVLVAGTDPVALVLADFGSSRSSTVSRQFSAVQMTELYAAPEALNGHLGSQQDWWALGMVLLETLLGRHPYRGLESMTVRDRLTSYDVDVTEVPDDDWRLLLQGLLTRSREHRWNHGQIALWLAGERPEVRRVADRGYPPIDVDGFPVGSPHDLARFFMGEPERAEDWLVRERERVADWLADDVEDTSWSAGPLRREIGRPATARRVMASFAAHFAPGEVPHFRGRPVDAEGLRALAANARQGRDTEAGERLTEILAERLLGTFARHRCTRGHVPGCGDEGCRLVGQLAADPNVPLIRGNAYEMLAPWARREGVPGTVGAVSAGSRDEVADRAEALTVWYLLDPDRARADAQTVLSGDGAGAAWWTELRDAALSGAGPQHGAVALALAVTTREDAAAEHRARARAEELAAQEAAERERERRRAARTAAAAQRAARQRDTLRRAARPLARWSSPALLGAVFLGLLEVLRLLDPSAQRGLYELALDDPSSWYSSFFFSWYFEANRWIYEAPLAEYTGPLTERAEPWAQLLVLVLGIASAVALALRSRLRGRPTPGLLAAFAAVAACAVGLVYLLLPEAVGVLAAFSMGVAGGIVGLVLIGVGWWTLTAGR